MKYSFVFVTSLAGMAIATPVSNRRADAKLPFLEPGEFSVDCGFRGFDDKTCGTDVFCKGFDENPKPFGIEGNFKNSKECFDAHEKAAKLPFLEPGNSVECGFHGFDEQTCGTDEFCKGFDEDPKPMGIDGDFKNSKECFDAHEAPPSQAPPSQAPTPTPTAGAQAPTKLPFKEAGDDSCVTFPGQREDCLGTKKYCETKAWKSKGEPKQYASPEACLADRQAAAAN